MEKLRCELVEEVYEVTPIGIKEPGLRWKFIDLFGTAASSGSVLDRVNEAKLS